MTTSVSRLLPTCYPDSLIDFISRIDELSAFLAEHYQLTPGDRNSIELLLSLLVKLPGSPRPPSILLEADWASRDLSTAWFTCGGLLRPHHIGDIIHVPYRRGQVKLKTEVDEEARGHGIPVCWVEDRYTRPRHWPFNTKGDGWTMSEHFRDSLRLRVSTPRSLAAIQIDRGEAGKRTAMISHLVRHIVDSPVRPVDAPRLVLPRDYAYWVGLGHKLTRPDTVSWEALADSLAQVAVRHAYLVGKPATDDWRAVAALLAMQVPDWTAGLVRMIERAGLINRRLVIHRAVERDFYGPECALLEFKDIRMEIERLVRIGVFQVNAARTVYPARDPDRTGLRLLLEGEAFTS